MTNSALVSWQATRCVQHSDQRTYNTDLRARKTAQGKLNQSERVPQLSRSTTFLLSEIVKAKPQRTQRWLGLGLGLEFTQMKITALLSLLNAMCFSFVYLFSVLPAIRCRNSMLPIWTKWPSRTPETRWPSWTSKSETSGKVKPCEVTISVIQPVN